MDDGENNIHIVIVDDEGNFSELAETTGVAIRTAEDGSTSGRMWVEYCSDQILRMFINNEGNTKPATPQLEVFVDLADFFDGTSVNVGYTGSKWFEADNHDITSWTFEQSCASD